jgi:chemotaxis protein CheD
MSDNFLKVDFKTHFLFPAALFVSKEPYLVTTILGSCVSVCLWDTSLNTGGINHFMLPLWNGQGLASPKYGNIAVEKLVGKMISLGCRKENLVAKIYGGGEIIPTSTVSKFNIGERNVDFAREMLAKLNLKVISTNAGGKNGRKIIFNTFTGEVKHFNIDRLNDH